MKSVLTLPMIASSTSMCRKVKAAPVYISQPAASTDVGGRGRSGAGVYLDIGSVAEGCGHDPCAGADHEPPLAGAVIANVCGVTGEPGTPRAAMLAVAAAR